MQLWSRYDAAMKQLWSSCEAQSTKVLHNAISSAKTNVCSTQHILLDELRVQRWKNITTRPRHLPSHPHTATSLFLELLNMNSSWERGNKPVNSAHFSRDSQEVTICQVVLTDGTRRFWSHWQASLSRRPPCSLHWQWYKKLEEWWKMGMARNCSSYEVDIGG